MEARQYLAGVSTPSTDFMFDDLIALQYLFREEQELSKMFKRLFEI